jgi:hypothetical protein
MPGTPNWMSSANSAAGSGTGDVGSTIEGSSSSSNSATAFTSQFVRKVRGIQIVRSICASIRMQQGCACTPDGVRARQLGFMTLPLRN